MGKPQLHFRTSLDIRATDDVDGFEGHAASFWSVDSYGTAFAPGAFKKTIRERKERIPVLWNHNSDTPVGKHLEMKEDLQGLFVNVGIADDGADGTVLLKRLRFGVPLGLSFGFETIKDRTAEDGDPIDMSNAPSWLGKGKDARNNIRVITEVKYWESSPVTFPANENSAIDDIRSARTEQEADFLTSLLEDLRSDAIPSEDGRLPLLRDLVAAFNERSEPKPDPLEDTTPLLPIVEARRRNRYAEASLLFSELGYTLELAQA